MKTLAEFARKNEYLVCVDSDGCAMDTMDIKHINCFGPCMIDEWGLGQWRETILDRWNDINLYSMTRGINRFLALAMTLEEVDRDYCRIDGIREFSAWTQKADELSNGSVGRQAQETGQEVNCGQKWTLSTSLPSTTRGPHTDLSRYNTLILFCRQNIHRLVLGVL